MPDVRTGDPVGHLWGIGLSQVEIKALNCLTRNGISTIADLLKHDAPSLRDLRAFGAGCLAEVRRALADHGLALAGEEARDG